MSFILPAAVLFYGAYAQAAPAPSPRLTAAQVIEKSIEATGGRAALAKVKSTLSKGFMRVGGREEHTLIEFYAKVPDKRLVVTNVEGFGETRQGFDGKAGWRQDPAGAVTELAGDELEAFRRESVFNPALQSAGADAKAVLKGKTKIEGRDAWFVILTGNDGAPALRYYDAETFLLVRQTVKVQTGAGPMDVTVDFSDYRDAGAGIKAPFRMRQITPGYGEIVIEIIEIRNNAEIDDAIFSKPAPPQEKNEPDFEN